MNMVGTAMEKSSCSKFGESIYSMPKVSLIVSTTINANPEVVFAYVADLTRHGEWSANQLTIEAVSTSPIRIGSLYRSTAEVRRITISAELRVSQYLAPLRFGFDGQDLTGNFSHLFTFMPFNNGTKVVRQINFTLSLQQWLMFWVLYFPVRRPALKKSLRLLKQRLEQIG